MILLAAGGAFLWRSRSHDDLHERAERMVALLQPAETPADRAEAIARQAREGRCRAILVAIALLLAQPGADLAGVAEALARMHRHAASLPAGPAIAELRSSLQLPLPSGSQGDQLRGDVLAELSRRLLASDDAAGALQSAVEGLKAIAPDPSPVQALLLLREAEALEALGRDSEAVDTYEKTIDVARFLMAKETP